MEGGWAARAARNKSMKRRLLTGILLTLALCCLCVFAMAETSPLKVSMELSTSKFTEPKSITVSIQVSNVGEGDMPGPCTLYYPNGKQVEEFGSPTLAVGASKSWSGTWKVTQAQLDAGKITFKLKYPMYNDQGELINKSYSFSKKITYEGAVATLEINRTIAPTTARKGQEVTVTYDVVNSGNVDVTDVSIKENSSISSKAGTIAKVAAGSKESYTFKVTMGTKNLTSQATITYKADGKTQTTKKEAATIKYGQVNITAALKADKKGGAVGDTAKLTLTLKNTGKVDYQNVTVTDPTLGEVFSGETVAAGKTLTLEKEVAITQTTDYQFTVKAQTANGAEVETATGRVTVTAVDPAQVITLSVEATADRNVVYVMPGTVRFTVSVTNQSSVDVSSVGVYAVDTLLYTFPKIPAGETRSFTRDTSISMAGQFAFNARCKDQLNETVTFMSNTVPVSFETPTAVPTEAPIVTPPKPVHEELPTDDGLPGYLDGLQSLLNVLKWLFMVLAVAGLALLAVGLVRRNQAKRESDAAMDHLERGSYRDYSQPAQQQERKPAPKEEQPVTRPIGEDALGEDLADVENDGGQQGDIMAETLAKLYPCRREAADASLTVDVEQEPEQDVPEEAAQTVEEMAAEEQASAEEQTPAESAPTEPTTAQSYTHRRRRRTDGEIR